MIYTFEIVRYSRQRAYEPLELGRRALVCIIIISQTKIGQTAAVGRLRSVDDGIVVCIGVILDCSQVTSANGYSETDFSRSAELRVTCTWSRRESLPHFNPLDDRVDGYRSVVEQFHGDVEPTVVRVEER